MSTSSGLSPATGMGCSSVLDQQQSDSRRLYKQLDELNREFCGLSDDAQRSRALDFVRRVRDVLQVHTVEWKCTLDANKVKDRSGNLKRLLSAWVHAASNRPSHLIHAFSRLSSDIWTPDKAESSLRTFMVNLKQDKGKSPAPASPALKKHAPGKSPHSNPDTPKKSGAQSKGKENICSPSPNRQRSAPGSARKRGGRSQRAAAQLASAKLSSNLVTSSHNRKATSGASLAPGTAAYRARAEKVTKSAIPQQMKEDESNRVAVSNQANQDGANRPLPKPAESSLKFDLEMMKKLARQGRYVLLSNVAPHHSLDTIQQSVDARLIGSERAYVVPHGYGRGRTRSFRIHCDSRATAEKLLLTPSLWNLSTDHKVEHLLDFSSRVFRFELTPVDWRPKGSAPSRAAQTAN